MADVIVDAFIREMRQAQTIGEQRGAQSFDNGGEGLARRQLRRHVTPLPVFQRRDAQRPQLRDNIINTAVHAC